MPSTLPPYSINMLVSFLDDRITSLQDNDIGTVVPDTHTNVSEVNFRILSCQSASLTPVYQMSSNLIADIRNLSQVMLV